MRKTAKRMGVSILSMSLTFLASDPSLTVGSGWRQCRVLRNTHQFATNRFGKKCSCLPTPPKASDMSTAPLHYRQPRRCINWWENENVSVSNGSSAGKSNWRLVLLTQPNRWIKLLVMGWQMSHREESCIRALVGDNELLLEVIQGVLGWWGG